MHFHFNVWILSFLYSNCCLPMLSYVYFLGLCLIHALTSQVLHVTCDTGEDLWEKSATVLLKQLGMKKLNGYKYFCQIHIAIIHNMQRCTFKSSKVGSTPLVHWNWIKLPWKNVIRQEVDYLLLKTRFYLANFSFSAILSEVRNAFLFGDFERKTIMQIAGWLSWQWKPYFFFKIHICLDFKHLVMDAQFSLYEYNSIIPTHFHHGWNYHSENIPLVRRTCFLVPRDFLNKNRMQGITVQSWVNRRQHEMHFFLHQVLFFILVEGKLWRTFTSLWAFSEQLYLWWIVCKIFLIWSCFSLILFNENVKSL